VELVVPAEVAPRLEPDVDVLEVSALAGGAIVFADAVKSADVVSAFEPAEVEPFPDELAGAPEVPEAAFA
jgi:hypothetical protein